MDRLIEFPNEALAGRLLQVNYEQALKHFLDIDMSQHTLWDLHFGEDVDWLDEDIAVQIQNHPEDRPAINAIQTLKGQASQSLLREILHSRPEACRDDDEGPNRMWLHVHRGLTDMNELDCRLLAFRLYGYVFWDNDHAERAITHRNLYSIPYFIRHTNAVYGAPAFGHFAEENRAMGPARAARVVLLDAGHRGRFDFQRFFADSMADNDEITDLTHALHYHPPSAQTCRACAAMDRGDWREEELQLHRAEEVIINGVQVLHIN